MIPAGRRLTFRNGSDSAVLRVLYDTPMDGHWRIPVLAEADALGYAGGEVELPDEQGIRRHPARLCLENGRLVLRPGTEAGGEPVVLQRRQDVRGAVHLPVRGMVLGTGLSREAEETTFEGVTLSVSAGGLSIQLMPDMTAVMESAPQLEPKPGQTPTKRLFLELQLPEGSVVPTVVSLVGVRPYGVHGYLDELRGTFEDIAAADRERLVSLVFEQERWMLRRRSGTPGPISPW